MDITNVTKYVPIGIKIDMYINIILQPKYFDIPYSIIDRSIPSSAKNASVGWPISSQRRIDYVKPKFVRDLYSVSQVTVVIALGARRYGSASSTESQESQITFF